MLYNVKLRISYTYEQSADSHRTLLRMLPRTLPYQSLIQGVIEADPHPSRRRDSVDFFGNPTTDLSHDMALSQLSFQFRGRVRRSEPFTGLDLSSKFFDLPRDLAAVRDIGPNSPHHFIAASPRVPMEKEITTFARSVVNENMSTLTAARALSSALNETFDFDPTATDVSTPPIVAFRNRRGVCQDITHVMIAGLRGMGIPAGYVSGFLRTVPPQGQARLEGADAMHAWVRCWCGPEIGWFEVDPTNAIDVATDHITVAFGRDYADVAPAKGSLRSQGSHKTSHVVDVVPVDETTARM